ncbi:HAMP domain-containing sensor histidine kinase [Kitasatospora sp. NPDC089797]|uniref:sensor histidine kinase n=1 Tax=Kitasatospora sp. NPDC089797 TaxID=3155298 RepID=UPI003428DFD1
MRSDRLRPLLRPWHRCSVRVRAALGAALASAVAFSVAALWVGGEVHDQWTAVAEDQARNSARLVADDVPTGTQVWDATLKESFLLVLADGRPVFPLAPDSQGDITVYPDAGRLGINTLLGEYAGRPAEPFTDLPPYPQDVSPGRTERVRVTLPRHTRLWHWPGNGPSLTGRDVTLVKRATDRAGSEALRRYTGIAGLPDQRVTVYLLVDPTPADQAEDRVAAVLTRYVLPGAAAFTALTAWLVTGLALRPVESIRRGMARIGAGAFHERVPVPPSRDAIARLAETTNTTLGRLEHAIDEQRRLVSDASHELRSPLAALRSSLEVPLAHPAGVDWPGVVRDALADTERLQRLTDDLLLLAAVEEPDGPPGGGRAEPVEPVDLADLVGEQVAERAHLSAGRPAFLAVSLETAPVPGAELRLGRLVRNLLDNAARHARTAVAVSVTVEDGCAVLTVTDDGPGIPPEDRERVFDRFVRLDDARSRDTGGTGLGLALVRAIARGVGGTIAFTDPPSSGPGARAVVRLPLAPEPGSARPGPDMREPAPHEPAPPGPDRREPDVREPAPPGPDGREPDVREPARAQA